MTKSNEVAETGKGFGTNVSMPNAEALSKALKSSSDNSPRGGAPDGSLYLNFSGKRGTYNIGTDKRLISDDELWLVNIAAFEDGWVCWKGGAPKAKRFANIAGVPVAIPESDEFGPFDSRNGEGWFQAKSMIIKSLDNDEQGYFSINSISGVSVFADLQGDISTRLSQGNPCWPLIELGTEEFKAQGHTNFKPVFNVYGWLDDVQVQTLFDSDDIDIDELIAASGKSLAPTTDDTPPKGDSDDGDPDPETDPDPDPTPDPEPDQPKRRRRRKASV